MDDLERDLATQLRRRSEEVTPGDDLPARIRAQVDRHQQRRRLMQTAVPTLCLLVGVVTVVAVVGHGGTRPSVSAAPSAGPSHGQAPSTTRPLPAPSNGSSTGAPSAGSFSTQAPASGFGATAATWVPVDYGNVQVSVPSGAVIGSSGCPDPTAPVTIRLGRQPAGVFGCPFEPAGVTTLTLESLPAGNSTSGLAAHTVNGVRVFTSFGSPTAAQELVPSLGVEVEASGPLASRVLGTLTRSARAVALAGGRAPRVPRSWHRVTFGGLSVAVPATWTVEHMTDEDASCEPQPPGELRGVTGARSRPTVILDTGHGPLPSCPTVAAEPDQPVEPAPDGLTIDPGPVGPLSGVTAYSPCISVDRLRVCPADDADQYGGLVLRVQTTDGKKVALVIGDDMSGETARTILHSLRPA